MFVPSRCRAATGYFMQEFIGLPNYPGYTPNPVEAFSSVPAEGLAQIALFLSFLEITMNKGKFTQFDM